MQWSGVCSVLPAGAEGPCAARRCGVPLRPPVPPQRHDCPQLGDGGSPRLRGGGALRLTGGGSLRLWLCEGSPYFWRTDRSSSAFGTETMPRSSGRVWTVKDATSSSSPVRVREAYAGPPETVSTVRA